MDVIRPAATVFLSVAVCVGCVPLARKLAGSCGMIAHPRQDRFHQAPVPLLGGPACLFAWTAGIIGWILMTGSCFPAAGLSIRLAGAAGLGVLGFLILGLLDDRRAWSPLWKGALQGLLLVAVLLVWRPEGRLASFGGCGLAWLGAMVLINAWNYLDHADGIFASTSAVASSILAVGWVMVIGWGCVAGSLWAFCGAMLGFVVWNAPPARIFLGDAGSLPLGFLPVLAALALIDFGPREAVPIAIAAHCVPFTDMLLVSVSRLRRKIHPFRGGLDHSAHRLAPILGRWGALLAFSLAAAGFGAVGILGGAGHPTLAAAVLPLFSLLLALGLLRLKPPGVAPAPDPPV